MKLVVEPQEELGQWVGARVGLDPEVKKTALGFSDDEGVMLAAAAFTDFNGMNIYVHLVVDQPGAFRALIRAIGNYAFGQLNCKRLTLAAEASNVAAVELHKRLGAVHEGTLVGASRSGDDILLSRFEPTCEFWRKVNGRR